MNDKIGRLHDVKHRRLKNLQECLNTEDAKGLLLS